MATEEENVPQGIAKGEPHPNEPEGIAKGEPNPNEPQNFVVVLAYTSTDGEVEEDFAQLVNDIRALYSFKQDLRVYAVVEESAKNVLALLEKPKETNGG